MNNSYTRDEFQQIVLLFYRLSISSSRSKSENILSPRKSDANDLSTRQSGKEWSCSWYLVKPQLSKILSYVILHNLILTQNFWQFQRILEQVKQKLQKSGIIEHTMYKISLEWEKLSKLFFHQKKDIWGHTLAEILKKMPNEIHNYILQCYNLLLIDTNDCQQLKQSLKHLAFKLKSKRITINDIFGLSQIQYNLGFVDSISQFVLASEFPELKEYNRVKLQVLNNFQLNLCQLLQQYQQSNTRLNEIEGVKNFMQAEAKIKEFINAKK